MKKILLIVLLILSVFCLSQEKKKIKYTGGEIPCISGIKLIGHIDSTGLFKVDSLEYPITK